VLRRAFKLANKARLKSDSERNRVYVEHLRLKDFRSFREGSLTLNIPAKRSRANLLSNVNVILGNNGDGKSSILRAVALACLGPSLRETGFVPYRLVRRPRAKFARISADVILSESELITAGVDKLTLDCDILRRGRSDNDLITSDDIDYNLFQGDFFDDSSDAMFLVGYGATRAVETSDYSEGTALKSRGARYQRVAGLFEDHVRLVPFHRRRLRRARSRMPEMIKLLNRTLPPSVKCSGLNDQEDLEFIVSGVRTPFASLSDGFKAFAGWVADFLGRLAEVVSLKQRLTDVAGIALVDEIDLHLHPSWQRTVVPNLASVFPNIQFIFTSHSPIIAGSVTKNHVFLTERAADRTSTVLQLEERIHGRSVDHILLSAYFGLESTRPDDSRDVARDLFARAAQGDATAALTFLRQFSGSEDEEPGTAIRPRGVTR
jgi:AAA domain, putative AbiEii toxin, Type IV TA system/AAA domain